LKNIFEKIRKNIKKTSPHYAELTAISKEITDKLAADKSLKELSADKYFVYFKMVLEGDNLKIIESVLEQMQKLIREDLLLGRMDDLPGERSHRNMESQRHSLHFHYKRKLIDSMVDSVIKLFNINDENIWLNAVKILYTMYKNPNIKIHNESLLKMFKICIRIYLSSLTGVNIDTTKSSLSHMILHLFNKMEQSNAFILARDSAFKLSSEIEEKESIVSKDSIGGLPRPNSDFSSPSGFKMYGGINYKNPVEDLLNRVLKKHGR
jgi:hypothetical protein